jgi:streptomycin 6-kinase
LTIDGEPWHGYVALVVPVRRGDELCALKISWVDDETRHEALALQLWGGEGAVKLLDAQPEQGVLLLERLNATNSLAKIEIDEAATIAGQLLRRLAIPAPSAPEPPSTPLSPSPPPAPPEVPLLRDYAKRQSMTMHHNWDKLGRPFPERLINLAQDAARELGPSAGNLLVNQDLHYENVLAGSREPWLVIDPKIIMGDVEFGVAPLLWNRLEKNDRGTELSRRFDILVDSAELDEHRARCWTLVRCVDYWLWALDIGLTEDPLRCEIIVDWLVQARA